MAKILKVVFKPEILQTLLVHRLKDELTVLESVKMCTTFNRTPFKRNFFLRFNF